MHLQTRGTCTLLNKPLKAISSYYTTLLSNRIGPIRKHLPPFFFMSPRLICLRMREGQKILLFLSLIYLCSTWRQTGCPWEVLRSWNRVTIMRKNHNTTTDATVSFLNLWKYSSVVFHVLKTVFIKLLETFQELPITKSGSNNFAGGTSPKPISLMNTFLRMNKEFRNNFVK